MNDCRVDFDSPPWERPAPGVRTKAVVLGRTRLRLVVFTDQFVEMEWCAMGHIGYVVEGEMAVEFSCGVTHFRAGDGLFIPAGEAHRHRHFSTKHSATLFLVENGDNPAWSVFF